MSILNSIIDLVRATLSAGDKTYMFFLASIVVSILMAMMFSSIFQLKTKIALNPEEFQPFTLIGKVNLSHDTRRFTFALQSTQTKLGLPIGQHISFRFTDTAGQTHQRTYTPVTGDEVLGQVSFVIKVYKAGVHPKFPDGGKMSQYLDSLQIGDTMDMKGPKGHVKYLGRGRFTVKELGKPLQDRQAKHLGMIAGGTGITPMMQLIQAILRDEKDSTTIRLLYANQSEDDILLRQEIDFLHIQHPKRFTVHYTIDRPSNDWKGSVGFVNKTMIENHILPLDSALILSPMTQIFMCGPPPMLKFACLPALRELQIKDTQLVSF